MSNITTTTFSPYGIGWDSVINKMWGINNANVGTYPPYNMIKKDDNTFILEFALAGWNKKDIEISEKDRVITISGSKEEKEGNEYVHKGISSKKFEKSFSMAEYIKVERAEMSDGILSIEFIREVPEEAKPRQITIK